MLQIRNFKVTLDEDDNLSLQKIVAQKLNVDIERIKNLEVVKKSLDARKNKPLKFIYSFYLELTNEKNINLKNFKNGDIEKIFQPKEVPTFFVEKKMLSENITEDRPIVVGLGPAGIFAALTLVKNGLKPLIIERGASVEERVLIVHDFWKKGIFNKECNVQFGEGGAGTFSDGKLTARSDNSLKLLVLQTLVEMGAPSEILYWFKPHVGTDLLKKIIVNIRNYLIKNGAEICFNTCLTDIFIKEGQIKGIEINHKKIIHSQNIFLAIGHSARDTYELLARKKIMIQPKPFAMGLRIEHSQSMINKAQLGMKWHKKLGSADYALTFQDTKNKRSAFSFCMCPGGKVIAASSEEKGIVTNGMSNYARNSGFANSALVVNVTPEDFGNEALAGIEFQRFYEQKAYLMGGGSYFAPAMSAHAFVFNKKDSLIKNTTYEPNVKIVDLNECLPKFVSETLKQALLAWDKKINGFLSQEAMLIGVETRTSAPLRILRNESFNSVNVDGLYPIGEGSGYAGGIISSSVDAIRAVKTFIINRIKK